MAASFSSVSQPPLAPVALVAFSSLLAPSAPQPHLLAPFLVSPSPSVYSSLPPVLQAPPVSTSSSLSLPSWQVVPGGSGGAPGFGAVPVSLPVAPPISAPSFFRPFCCGSSTFSAGSCQLLFLRLYPPLLLPRWFIRAPSSSSAPPPFLSAPPFVAPDELPEDATADSLPSDVDSAVPAAVPESVQSEFRCMLSFLVDLFPQAAGAPSASLPPCALL